jgi:hypothetical protein
MIFRARKNIYIMGTTFAGLSLILLIMAIHHGANPVTASYAQSDRTRTIFTNTVFLPIIFQENPCILSGKTTINGNPTSVILGLYQVTTSNKTMLYTMTTDLNGDFCFRNVPILPSCDNSYGYAIGFGYKLPVPGPQYASSWTTGLLHRCEASQAYTDIQAELSDVTILSPAENITVTLPITFSWSHPAVVNGSYLLFVGHGACFPINVGYATTYVFNDPNCEKPGLPVDWYLLEQGGGTRISQPHQINIH